MDRTWARIQAELRAAVTDSAYHLWLEPLRPAGLAEDVLLVAAPDDSRGWVAERFGRVLQACAAAVLGPEVTVQVVSAASVATPETPARSRPSDPSLTFNPKYRFDQFVIGDANHLAHGAALAVAELPGQAYNPLFIYGAPGLGKTHLLHAIGHYVREHGEGLAVRYATIEAFTDEFVGALKAGGLEAFKERYRGTDVLLVDDVQFLESKARTEAEFFHTFNALYEAGSQLVLTSDRTPADLSSLHDRLRERFACGLVTDVKPPDLETRVTILRMRARRDDIAIEDEGALVAVAQRAGPSVRALEGALVRVVALHSLTRRPISPELVEQVLGPGAPRPAADLDIEEIQEGACRVFGVTREELVSPSRTARVAWARQAAMYLARELTDETLPAIGRRFGNRNHSTVLHACRTTDERIRRDGGAYQQVERLREQVTERR